MRIFRHRLAMAGAGLAAVVVAVSGVSAAAAAAPTYRVTTDPAQAAAGWLAGQFEDKTHLPSPNGDHFDSKSGKDFYPSYGENADVIFGLAAAKVGKNKIDTALRYLAANLDGYADVSKAQGGPFDGSVGKVALAAIVTGGDPANFAGVNLMKTLQDDERAGIPGYCTKTVVSGQAANLCSSAQESFVILAEARKGGTYAPSKPALAYLSSLQCTNGGFTTEVTACGSGAADLDSTSYAIMALSAAGGHAAELAKAVTWLEGQQKAGGYWVSQGIPNPNSTGLAAAALQSQRVDVGRARSWLRSQQARAGAPGAGAVKYAGSVRPTTTAATSPSVLATAQSLIGLVDGASLATLTATGASSSVPMFAPAATLSASSARIGARATVNGDGFVAGEKVSATIHSKPVGLGTATASALGGVTLTYTVPSSVAVGAHTVTLTGLTSGLSAQRALTVTAAATNGTNPVVSTTPAGPATGPIAATGLDGTRLVATTLLGLLAVCLGAGALVLGRRRER